jgi:transglutaminase-like putative cysteine protease
MKMAGRGWLGVWWVLAGCEAEPAHVYIPALRAEELTPYGGVSADAVRHGGKVVAPPEAGPLRSGKEKPLFGGPGPGEGRDEPGRRSLVFKPDRVTELHGRVAYYEVFSPQVAPFKRVTALDAVGLDGAVPVLHVREGARTPVPVLGLDAPPPDARPRDRFWGSVVLDFREGGNVPLPSVAPETRILSVATEPHVEVSFSRDAADNLSLLVAHPPAERVRLTYLIDAPRTYFGADIPDAATDVLRAHVAPLPAPVAREASQFLAELGLDPRAGLKATLLGLVEHFRSFEESSVPPADTGHVFLDLARNRRGVCRHRAYAFVIAAHALGIPARLVQNEAHAWVEVEVPEHGYIRVDLGGAAEGLEPVSVDERPRYQPDVPDPWPRPRAYREAYARAAERARRDQQRRGAPTTGPTAAPARSATGSAKAPRNPSADNPGDGRVPTTLRIARFAPEVMRGTSLTVAGSAQEPSGQAIPGLRVEVSLAEHDASQLLLGVGVTDARGQFALSLAVPPDLAPAEYTLLVETPGDARHAPARAD